MRDLRDKLLEVARELGNKLFCHPHATEDTEELPQLLHLIRALQNVELSDVSFS